VRPILRDARKERAPQDDVEHAEATAALQFPKMEPSPPAKIIFPQLGE